MWSLDSVLFHGQSYVKYTFMKTVLNPDNIKIKLGQYYLWLPKFGKYVLNCQQIRKENLKIRKDKYGSLTSFVSAS